MQLRYDYGSQGLQSKHHVRRHRALSFTDGALTANTALAQGVIGNRWRVKLVSVGTYAGGTTLNVDVVFGRARMQAAPGSGVF